ncbi:MAG: NUDIX domain-containing protein [Anaerolineaceae bacterium]|nr:NUDIX domain-containing protein [Anaerolineaceae bacterium]
MITCTSIYGHKIDVPREKLFFRPAVYAVLIEDGKILLVTIRSAKKYFFPGGGVNIGEKLEGALKRELMEETGLEIDILQFLGFKEDFFYYDPTNAAFHGLLFFYLCTPKSTQISADDQIIDDEATKPRWVQIETQKGEDFLGSDPLEVIELIKRANQLSAGR